MTDLAMTFPEIPLADIEARAQKLLDDYEGHVGLRIQAPIPVENIAEHTSDIRSISPMRAFSRILDTSAVSCSMRT